MIVLLEYGRKSENKSSVYGRLSIQSSLGAGVLDNAEFDGVQFELMAKMFVDTVKQLPEGSKVYFRRMEQPDRAPMEMLAADVDRLRENPDEYLHNMCNPAPVVLDLRSKKDKDK